MIEATTVGLIQETQCQWFEPRRLRSLLLTVDGTGSGIDADKLDGQEGAYYLPAASYTAADILTKIKTVDGAGSGLDADLLDGSSSAAFAKLTANTFTALQTVSGVGEGLRLVGTGATGATSIAYLTFFDSDGVTRRGIVGDYNFGTTDIILKSDTGALHLGDSTSNDVIVLSAGGTKILGNIGFYNTTPVARPAAYTQTYATADRTIAARTSAAITNNTGGTVSTTFAAITAGAAYAQADMTAVKNALASIADQFNKLRNDHLDTTQGLNSVIDDGQTLGLLQ